MNRAERRQQEKAANRAPRRIPHVEMKLIRACDARPGGWQETLMFASKDELTQQQRDAIVTPYYARIEQLRTGHLDEQGFVEINEGLAAAYSLAMLIYKRGTRAAKDAVMPSADVFKAAAEALNALGMRFLEKGKYMARGEELEHIRAGAQWLDEMLKISDEGIALKALRQAAQLVSQKLKEQMR